MTNVAAALKAWRPLTADDVLAWSDEELRAFALKGGNDLSISVSYLIWRLEDDGMHTPTSAAIDRFPASLEDGNPCPQKAMKSRLANYKRRARITSSDAPEHHNRNGACPGWLWKTLVYHPGIIDKDGNPFEEGKALIRIALAPRLGQALMALTRKAGNKASGAELYGMKGLIRRLDSLNVFDLVDLVRFMETGAGPCPTAILSEIESLAAAELWTLISWLGLNTARETWRARSAPEDAKPEFSIADACEISLDLKDQVKEKFMGVTIAAMDQASKVVALAPRAKAGKFIAVSLILGMFLTVGAATVAYIKDADSLIHTLRTKGVGQAINLIQEQFTDEVADHRTRAAIAWVVWRNGDSARARRIISKLIESKPEPYVMGLCYYILGSLDLEIRDVHLALSCFDKAERYFTSINDDRNTSLTKIEKSLAYAILDLHDRARMILDEVTPADDLMLCTVLEVRGRIEQETGNLTLALAIAQKRYEKLNELDLPFKLGYALKDIGFIHAGLGDLTSAKEATEAAIEESIFTDNEKLGYFALCNRVAINRCSGVDYSSLASRIVEYAKANNLPSLIEYLDEALELDCPPGV